MAKQREDVVGKRYGRLTIISDTEDSKRRHRKVICQCDCGNEKAVSLDAIRDGRTISCGCRMREIASIYRKTHGRRNTPEFSIWSGMRQRCNNIKNNMYQRYGGRGIQVCPEWDASFQQFFADMGPRPSPNHSIDRINNEGPYAPWNCRWTTKEVQANNTSTNKFIEYDGQRRTISEWAKTLQIPAKRIQERISLGWSFEKIVQEPFVTPASRARRNALTMSDTNRYRLAQASKAAWQDAEKKAERLKKREETMRLKSIS